MFQLNGIKFPLEVIQLAKEDGDLNMWGKIISDVQNIKDLVNHPLVKYAHDFKTTPNPDGKLRSRDIFTYALVLCEHAVYYEKWIEYAEQNGKLKRVEELKAQEWETFLKLKVLFGLAKRMQTRNGNFKWFWKDRRAQDPNGVNFCMRGAALMCVLHRQRLEKHCPNEWKILLDMIKRAVRGACRKPVPEKFTNMAMMNAMNLILIGESLNWPKIASEGYKRFDRICLYTWEWGIHEYISPTYTGIQCNCLALIQRYSTNERMKDQAAKLLKYYIHYGMRNLASDYGFIGTRSRRLWDYVGVGDARIFETLWVLGLDLDPQPHLRLIYPGLALSFKGGYPKVRQKEELKKALLERFSWGPEILTRESWGPHPNESRTVYQLPDVTLSTSSAEYDYPKYQDLPITAELIGKGRDFLSNTEEAENARCYFVPDIEHDPYGKNDNHHSPLHWAAAQNKSDALALVLYSPKQTRSLESHIVFPLNENMQIWDRDTEHTSRIKEAQQHNRKWQHEIKLGEIIFLRKDNAVVAVRPIWAQNYKGQTAKIKLICDTEDLRKRGQDVLSLVRLTVEHHVLGDTWEQKKNPRTQPGAAFWWRVASVEEGAFEDWRQKFSKQGYSTIDQFESLKQNMNDENTTEPFETRLTNPLKAQNATIKRNDNPHHIIQELSIRVDAEEELSIHTRSLNGKRYVTDLKPEPSQALQELTTQQVAFDNIPHQTIQEAIDGLEIADETALHAADTLVSTVEQWVTEQGIEDTTQQLSEIQNQLEEIANQEIIDDEIGQIIQNLKTALSQAQQNDEIDLKSATWKCDKESTPEKSLLQNTKKLRSKIQALYTNQTTATSTLGQIRKLQESFGETNQNADINQLFTNIAEQIDDLDQDNVEQSKSTLAKIQKTIQKYELDPELADELSQRFHKITTQVNTLENPVYETKQNQVLKWHGNQLAQMGNLQDLIQEIFEHFIRNEIFQNLPPNIQNLATTILWLLAKNNNAPLDGSKNVQALLNNIQTFKKIVKTERLDIRKERSILRKADRLESYIQDYRLLKLGIVQKLIQKNAMSPNGHIIAIEAETGRQFLKDISSIEQYENALQNIPLITLDKMSNTDWQTCWAADSGHATPPMTISAGRNLDAKRFVWVPKRGTDIGNMAWRIKIDQAKAYYIWAHVLAPRILTNEYLVRITSEVHGKDTPIIHKPWLIGTHKTWTWVPLDLSGWGKPESPTPIPLDAGEILLQFFGRKSNIKIDRLCISTYDNFVPNLESPTQFKRPTRKLRRLRRR